MSYLQALILSVVERITEFLPVSSTGHLILASKILAIPQTEFTKTFEISIQSGAIFAVVVLYGKRLLVNKQLLVKVFFAFLPTAVLGLVFYKIIKNYLIGNLVVTVLSLFLGGILIILLEKYFQKQQTAGFNNNSKTLTTKQCFYIGLFQSISMIPGVSRSAATIFGAMFLGLSRKEAVEFSFMLAIPTMLSATGLDLVKSASSFESSQLSILLFGSLASFIFAYSTIKWLLNFIKQRDFIPFGIYRIVLALAFLLLVK